MDGTLFLWVVAAVCGPAAIAGVLSEMRYRNPLR
jgi:hypothetical protein